MQFKIQIVAKRMVKKQQMQWSRQGALLATNKDCGAERRITRSLWDWYPELFVGAANEESEVPVKMAA